MGPWYRIGLPLGNSLVLVAITETIISTVYASHFFAQVIAEYHYGVNNKPPADFRKDFFEYPLWVLLALIIVTQLWANIILCFAVICKGSAKFLLFWVITTVIESGYSAFIDVNKQWNDTYDIHSALSKIFAFLWGTILFGFIVWTGLQSLCFMMNDNKEKMHPVGQGCCAIKDFYLTYPEQLAIIFLLSEVLFNAHRSFNFSTSPFLKEADWYLNLRAPDEHGLTLSIVTIALNCLGLIFIELKMTNAQKVWVVLYGIIMCSHVGIFLKIVFHWTADLRHRLFFDMYIVTCILHLVYKSIIVYICSKCSFFSRSRDNASPPSESEANATNKSTNTDIVNATQSL